MAIGEAELLYPKKKFDKECVIKEKNKFSMPQHWRIEENHKNYILKFKPEKIKQLKQFRLGITDKASF